MSNVENMDYERLNSLLPVELWVQLMEKSDKTTLFAIIRCSQYFCEVNKHKRGLFMFGDVYNLLRRQKINWKDVKPAIVTRNTFLKSTGTRNEEHNGNADEREDEYIDKRMLFSESEDMEEDEFQFGFDSVEKIPKQKNLTNSADSYKCDTCGGDVWVSWRSNILNLRFVCVKWKFAIDDYYANNCTPESSLIRIESDATAICKHFSKTHFRNGNVNPFIFRKGAIELYEVNSTFISSLKLLRKYGKFFDDLDITLYDTEELNDKPVLFPRLESVLFNTPNLTLLGVNAMDSGLVNEMLIGLKVELPKLNYAQLVDGKEATLIKYILGASKNLTGLEISGENLYSFDETGTPCTPEFHSLVNLRTLEVELSGKMKKCLFDCSRFKFLASLDLKVQPSEYYLPFKTLVSCISQTWANTLTTLKLEYSTMCFYSRRPFENEKFTKEILTDSMQDDILQIKNLKCFKMYTDDCFVSTNFLYSCRNTLEDVALQIKYAPKNKAHEEKVSSILSKEKVKFQSLISCRDEQKQMWKTFPNLNCILFKLKSFLIRKYTEKDAYKELDINYGLFRKNQ